MIQREKDLKTAGYQLVTGYVDTLCRYSIWQKDRFVVVIDDRTDRQISVGKLDSFGVVTGKHTYTVERDCCTSGQCLTCIMPIADFSNRPDDRVPEWVRKSRERARERKQHRETVYQPKTGEVCGCKKGLERDNCPQCEGTGMRIDFKAIHARRLVK